MFLSLAERMIEKFMKEGKMEAEEGSISLIFVLNLFHLKKRK